MPANNSDSVLRKGELRRAAAATSVGALSSSLRTLLQECILIQEGENKFTLYIAGDKKEKVQAALNLNFRQPQGHEIRAVRDDVYVSEREDMQTLWKIELTGPLADMIGKPIADGINKDIIRFASNVELNEGEYAATKLDEILSARAREKK